MPAPNTPQDLIDRIQKLERQVQSLAGQVNIRPALNTIVGGSVTIKDGGALVVQDSTGDNVLNIGRTTPDLNGAPQMATVIRRVDNSLAFAVWTSSTTGVQPVRIYDLNSNVIFADDTAAGGGLAIPWLSIPAPTPNVVTGATSAVWTTIAQSVGFFHHPKVRIIADIYVPSGTGQIRVSIGGTVVATGGSNAAIDTTVDVPSWAWGGVPQQKEILFQAIRNSGTGTISGAVRCMYGRQT